MCAVLSASGRTNTPNSFGPVTRNAVSVGTLWRYEKVGRIVVVFKFLREESIYNVGASLYRLAAGRWDER
jgi:hypothetical protein